MPFRRLVGKTRSRKSNLWLAAVLAFIAGLVDVLGYLKFQQFTSHVSGSVATVASALNKDMPRNVTRCMSIICSFLAGSAICATLVNFARRRNRESLFALPLLLEGVVLGAVGAFASGENGFLPLVSLALAMGLQNATITKISDAEIRTTHITGMMTDLGIELGRAIYPNRNGDLEPVRMRGAQVQILLTLVCCFFAGGAVGAFVFPRFGLWPLTWAAIGLGSLTILPIYTDLDHWVFRR